MQLFHEIAPPFLQQAIIIWLTNQKFQLLGGW